jgi:rare lipoprotein A
LSDSNIVTCNPRAAAERPKRFLQGRRLSSTIFHGMVVSVLCAAVPLHGARAAEQDVKSPARTSTVPRTSLSAKKAINSNILSDRRPPDRGRIVNLRRRMDLRPQPFARTTTPIRQPTVVGIDTGTVGDVIASGTASWYGSSWHGRRTSSGVPYDENALTAAHPWLPIGTRVRVTVEGSSESVVVTINDRPGSRMIVIDLSKAAARELGILSRGVARVTLTRA